MAPTGTAEERFEFQAEIRQLLHLLVYSLYTKKEIFIRELVSNASDALDKLRVLKLTESGIRDADRPLEIRIELDREHRVFSITDTGVGMTRSELVESLGTIARSGTAEFIRRLSEEKAGDLNLIGQFGVGFYSAFMAASEVRVLTRSWREGEPGQMWSSRGEGGYSVRELDRELRGTRVELDLREDAAEFVDPERIKGVIRKYSNFVPYPIYVDGEQVNRVNALWTRPKSEIGDGEYDEFYKFLTNDPESPASRLHLTSDAPLAFRAVLYMPRRNLERMGFGKLEHGPDLYARKVLIQHNCKDLVPDYLRFVRGVVDSEDIALNVSREAIQDDLVLRKIRRHLVRKILEHLEERLEKDREGYAAFHDEFGRILKEGVATDPENRERLGRLLLFNSSGLDDAEGRTSLKEYVGRMREGQKAIYYLAGPDRAALEGSPHLEMFRRRGVEILYLFDPVDDFVLSHLREFDGKPIKSADQVPPEELREVAAEGADAAAQETGETLAYKSGFDALLRRFREVLGDRVLDVRESERLAESPCLLAGPAGGPSVQVQKVLRQIDRNFEMARRTLEVNARHPLIRNLVRVHGEDPDSRLVSDCCEALYAGALLAEGILPDSAGLVPRLHRLMERATEGPGGEAESGEAAS